LRRVLVSVFTDLTIAYFLATKHRHKHL